MTDLLDRISGQERELVALARQIARDQGRAVFLVGGPLRDLLLERRLMDLDFTLESGAEEFARELVRRTNGTFRSYSQFLTHKVELPGAAPIDVATTRREEYPRPGSLPVVTPSGLHDDLSRRDFTINAMALEILSEELHDPFRGRTDLDQRQIRVLHDRSFADDPTRLYRAFRLGVRLGFRIEPHTADLIREAVEREFARTVSRERLWREFSLALAEPDRAALLEELAKAGALRVLLGTDGSGDHLAQLLKNADRLLAGWGGDAAVTFIAVLLQGRAPGGEMHSGSGLTRAQIEKIQAIGTSLAALPGRLRSAASEPERFDLCANSPQELLLLAAAEAPDLEPSIERFLEYKKVDLGVRGDELEVPSGPHIGQALERTRRALFFGEITRSEALAFARRVALEYLGRNVP